MVGRSAVAAAALVLVLSATAALPAGARTTSAVASHKLIVIVKKNLTPAAEKKLAVLVLVSQSGGAPAGAVATASKPLTVLLANRGFYRVKAEIDSSCRGTCAGSLRISGSANDKLEIVPGCRLTSSGFLCGRVRIVKLY